MTEMKLAKTEIYCTGKPYEPLQLRRRSLGGAILLAAIDDYRGRDEQARQEAAQFLYPQTVDWQDHFDWAVALAEGVNPAWLRDALDRFRCSWDRQRCHGQSRRVRRCRVR